MFQQLIEYFNSRRVLILGFGREGRSTYDVIRRNLPDKHIGIADRRDLDLNDENVTLHCGENYLDAMGDYDVIVKTPGMSFRDVTVPEGVEVTCQTDLFLRFSKCICVGITGTKGKTTTSTLIYEMVKQSGKTVSLIGNIGVPVLDNLAEGETEVAVIEMSSHQLEFTTASPHVAVMTNIYPEHLDHYNGFGGYVGAKLNILRHQTGCDYFICNAQQDFDKYHNFSAVESTVLKVFLDGSDEDAEIIEAAAANERLKGLHNRQNVCLAATAARCIGVSNEDILEAVRNFKGIENRMEPIGEYQGIKFYNDAIATIPHAVECAVEALGDVDTLIFGGMDRGIDYSGFVKYLEACKVKNLIGLPDTGINLCNILLERGCRKNIILAEDMEQAVDAAFRYTLPGKSCIMSPAASSYNVYKDFEHKGNHYKELVKSRG
ncbi:MAG: UDP-N-acetylmuramoyl-L-alanine--D-glutamate ligase [Ruminococcaceae bacterium]|nr:UDP-N-acetylmuramoyl-L-alanine--D-glutamate ligase [Oscillospiraceae bacterium]